MVTKRQLLSVVVFILILVVITCLVAIPSIERHFVAVHQRSVIRELNVWAIENSTIADRDSAVHAAEMIEYISRYYPICDGYRSDLETERQLRQARQQAMIRISDALAAYTGTDVADPLEWREKLLEETEPIEDGQ